MNDKVYLVKDCDDIVWEVYANESDAEKRVIELSDEYGEEYGYQVDEIYLIGKLEGDVIYTVVDNESPNFIHGEILDYFGSKDGAEQYIELLDENYDNCEIKEMEVS